MLQTIPLFPLTCFADARFYALCLLLVRAHILRNNTFNLMQTDKQSGKWIPEVIAVTATVTNAESGLDVKACVCRHSFRFEYSYIFYLQNNKIEQSCERIEYSNFFVLLFREERRHSRHTVVEMVYHCLRECVRLIYYCEWVLALRLTTQPQKHCFSHLLARATHSIVMSVHQFMSFVFSSQMRASVCVRKKKDVDFHGIYERVCVVANGVAAEMPCDGDSHQFADTNNEFNKFMNLFSVCIRKLCVAQNERQIDLE